MLFHVARIKSISEGDFWIYRTWLYDFGEPVGIFYPSIFFLIPALFFKLGASIEFIVNSFTVTIIAIAATCSFVGFKLLFDNERLATIGAICYICQWYFQMNLFFRTDLGESLAMAFLPLAIASSNCLLRNFFHRKSSWMLAVFSYTCVIESHLPTALILFGTLGAVWIFEIIRQKKLAVVDVESLSKVFLATLGLNAFFLVPLVYFIDTIGEASVTELVTLDGIPTTINLLEMWAVEISYALDCLRHAYFLTIPLLIFTGYKIFHHKLEYKVKWTFLSGLICLAICVVIESKIFPWELSEECPVLFRIIEFPWRIMSIASVYLTATIAIAVYQSRKFSTIICILLAAYSISFGGNAEFSKPQEYRGWFAYRTVVFSPDATSATFLPDWNHFERIDSLRDEFIYSNITREDLELWREFWNQREDKNELPILFYEGYHAVDDFGVPVDIEHSERHLIRFAYSEEIGKPISLVYEGLIEFKFAVLISFVTLGILLTIWRHALE